MRQIKPAFVIPAPSGLAIKTRLHLSLQDELVLRALGDHLGHLANLDLRAALVGTSWTARKRAITAGSSSRWAGAITRETNDQLRLAKMAQGRHRDGLAAAIEAIEVRLTIPAGGRQKVQRRTVAGYHDGDEIAAKQQRLQILKLRLSALETEIARGQRRIVRGGKRLLNTRHHLAEAGLSEQRWREFWWAARTRISANGSHDELAGNLTIRVSPEGGILILLPTPLRHLANDQDRYVLEAQASFSYRRPEWQAQIRVGAIAYEIRYDPDRRRWYLLASWTQRPAAVLATTTTPDLRAAPRRSVGVDLNADHLAAWVVDAAGNPVGRPISIPLKLTGSAGQRDGQLRGGISTLLRFTRDADADRIWIENLGFGEGKSRESAATKSFRNTISSFPTARFRQRLAAMAARAGIELVAVDPAYTSAWSVAWKVPTSTTNHATSGHEAAALGIARRGRSLSLSRREGVTKGDQRDHRRRATNQASQQRSAIRIGTSARGDRVKARATLVPHIHLHQGRSAPISGFRGPFAEPPLISRCQR
jgi:IS605 OrfB family transposase